jgi:hypothetical protein
MAGSKGLDKSAATVKAKSNILAEKIYPKHGSTTIGFQISKEEALRLARNLIMLALDPDVDGYITVTGHKTSNRVGVLGRKIKQKRRV